MQPRGKMHGIKDWGSKLPGTVARIAGLFHYAQYGSAADQHPISVNIVSSACEIARYFVEHALAAINLMACSPEVRTAKKILEYIKREKPETFKGRDVMRHTSLLTMAEVEPGLEVLCERFYIKIKEDTETKKIGRPEALTFKVNPRILRG